MKKLWDDPKLIDLSRAKPEEAILTFSGCHGTGPEADQSEKHTGCDYPPTKTVPCGTQCLQVSPS